MTRYTALACLLVFRTIGGAQETPSSLLAALTQAAHQKSHKDAARSLEGAKLAVQQGAPVTTADERGRTPLHWTVIAAMNAHAAPHRQACVDLADLLLSRGADVNAEDQDGNTALDWQEVSPHDDLLPLLLEHGARGGAAQNEAERLNSILSAVSTALRTSDLDTARAALAFHLPAGTELPIRLTTAVGSHTSWSGDPVEAVIDAPVRVGDRTVIGAGTKLRGTVMLAQPAANAYQRSTLILNFSTLAHANGAQTRLVTKLDEVDNARETVQAGRVLGLAHPNETKLSWGVRLIGLANPITAYALQAALFARDREYKREIRYEPGVEMTLTVRVPTRLAVVGEGAEWPLSPGTAEITALALAQPLRTATPDGTPSDLVNLVFLGSQQKLEAALQQAGWVEAAQLGLVSGLKTFVAVAESKGYKAAPTSLLLLEGQKPDLVYQKQNNTFSKRHHVRLWRRPERYQGEDVWVGAATHDIGIATRREGTQWIHRIDPRVDRERTKITNDLLSTGAATKHLLIQRPAAPRESSNATGDAIHTDGRLAVLIIR